MEDAHAVRGSQPIGDLNAAGQHELWVCRPFGNHLVQALARDVLHDDVGFIAVFADVVNRADIGMIDGRGQSRLAQLRGTRLLLRLRAALQQLHHHRPLQLHIVRQVDDTAAARANLADHFVMLDDAACHAAIIAVGARLYLWMYAPSCTTEYNFSTTRNFCDAAKQLFELRTHQTTLRTDNFETRHDGHHSARPPPGTATGAGLAVRSL
jgi:hypothetical protein